MRIACPPPTAASQRLCDTARHGSSLTHAAVASIQLFARLKVLNPRA